MTTAVRISDVCSTLRETSSPESLSDALVWLASIPAFDKASAPDLISPKTIGSNKLLLTRPCVLFSRLNPRIPRVWDLSTLPSGYRCLASTEFVPFVIEDHSRLFGRYLYWFLQSKGFVARARAGVEAATKSRERVEKDRLFLIPIPLPSLFEQQRIAATLDKADAIQRKRRESLRLLDELLRSAFLELFGDPVRTDNGWQTIPLAEVADIASGVTIGRRLEPRTWIDVPYIRVANVQDGHLDLSDVKSTPATPNEVNQFRLQIGDILLTEGGDPDKLGRGSIWRAGIENCIHQNHVFRVRLRRDELVPEYVSALIGSTFGKKYFLKAAKQTTGIASINKTQLGQFPVLVAPVELQRRYQLLMERFHEFKRRLQSAQDESNSLFDSLAHQAFGGGEGTKEAEA